MSDAEKVVAELRRAIMTGEDGCGTLPAREAVKVRPADWHRITKLGRQAADLIAHQAARLEEMTRERDEASGKRKVWHDFCCHVLKHHRTETASAKAALTAAEADRERLASAIRDLLALPEAKTRLDALDRGIGAATYQAAWLRARAALSEKETGA